MIRSMTALAGLLALGTAAAAAPQLQRVRGTVASVSDSELTIKTDDGKTETVELSGGTKYLSVVKSSLDNVTDGKFIGTATKDGNPPVALEVVIFPPALKGTGEGHYDWDSIHDTTVGGGSGLTKSAMTNGTIKSSSGSGSMTKSSMTNGTVKSGSMGSTMTKSSMTNGTVRSGSGMGGGKKIAVSYDGGKSIDITVPPSAPIVEFEVADKSIVKPGVTVFTNNAQDGGKLDAKVVAVGKDGVVPPM
jgi:hypothetical protein